LLVAARVVHLKGGKPPEHRGRQAAFLHDHHGLSWREVARQLCKRKHAHTRACRENFRKQAEQFWKQVGQLSRSFPLVKS
jgi:DNA primase